MNENEQPKKQINIALVILALIFIFPLGLFLMWKGKRFNQTARIVITCLLAVACIGYVVSPKKPTETPVDKSVPEVAQTTPAAEPAEPAPQETETIPEPNTSAMVDYIVTKAKTDSETITEEQKQEAVNFIKDNFENYFKDNDTMEKTMYYGALLEYGCEKDSDLSNLGMDAKQVVKYVYRGAEKPEDEATQANLRQIKKSLEKTGNNITSVLNIPYEIKSIDDTSIGTNVIRKDLNIILSNSSKINKVDFENLCQKIVEEYTSQTPVNALTLYFYYNESEIGKGYTIGMCTYYPNGNIGEASNITTGDYSTFQYTYTFEEKTAE